MLLQQDTGMTQSQAKGLLSSLIFMIDRLLTVTGQQLCLLGKDFVTIKGTETPRTVFC